MRPALATSVVLLGAIAGSRGCSPRSSHASSNQLGTLQSQLRTALRRLGAQFSLQVPVPDRTGLLLMVVLLFFLVEDRGQISGWLLRQVPEGRRTAVRAVGLRGWHALAGDIHELVLVAAIDALGVGLGPSRGDAL